MVCISLWGNILCREGRDFLHEQFTDAVKWAEVRAERVWRAAIFYWRLHNCLSALYWALAFAVPSGLAIMLYVPQDRCRTSLNIGLLITSGTRLVLQATVTAMRFKERAVRGRSEVNKLEGYILRRNEGLINKEDFMGRGAIP